MIIRKIIVEGKQLYSVRDSINSIYPGTKYQELGLDGIYFLETQEGREAYADESVLVEILKRMKPPEMSGFDKMLKTIIQIPKLPNS